VVVDLLVASVAERPDLAHLLDGFPQGWPEFMYQDPVAPLYYAVAVAAYPAFCLVAVDRQAPERALAKAHSVPFAWPDDPAERLPAGWDDVVLRATGDRVAGLETNLVSALEICVQPDLRGTGLSAVMVDAMRRNAARLGYRSLVAPVRPSGKHAHQDVPMPEYITWRRDDGLPVDPWLRVHVRAGGQILRVAPRSMTIPGTLAEWREWTGLPFDTTGPVHVPLALAPAHCEVAHDHAVYVEPNVWVHHRLT
jgi:GNAT superfamily N-acetyltransferase